MGRESYERVLLVMGRSALLLFVSTTVLGVSGCSEGNAGESQSRLEAVSATPQAHAAEPHGHASGDLSDWCGEHSLPESMCTQCDQELTEQYQRSGDWCAGHGFPESVCPSCHPMVPPNQDASGESTVSKGRRVQLRSSAVEHAAGIVTVEATTSEMDLGVETTARIDFNRNAMADVSTTVPGIVREVSIDLGQSVVAGGRLFTLESAHVGDLQARRQAVRERVEAARSNLARQEGLREDQITSQRQVELARQELEAAGAEMGSIEQSLRMSGASRHGRAGRFVVHSPISGVVIHRPALVGTFARESESLATVADTSVMWALLDVPEWDAFAVQLGQQVEVSVDGIVGQSFIGTVSWLSSAVDVRTRTVTARAAIQNSEGLLRAGQFAHATIRVDAPESAVTVPMEAVQRVGDQSVVFVRMSEGQYEPRVVDLGRSDGRNVQLTGEVQAGDSVVTTGAFLLRTELSRESIGTGCCETRGAGGD